MIIVNESGIYIIISTKTTQGMEEMGPRFEYGYTWNLLLINFIIFIDIFTVNKVKLFIMLFDWI